MHTGTQELFCHPAHCFYLLFCASLCATRPSRSTEVKNVWLMAHVPHILLAKTQECTKTFIHATGLHTNKHNHTQEVVCRCTICFYWSFCASVCAARPSWSTGGKNVWHIAHVPHIPWVKTQECTKTFVHATGLHTNKHTGTQEVFCRPNHCFYLSFCTSVCPTRTIW